MNDDLHPAVSAEGIQSLKGQIIGKTRFVNSNTALSFSNESNSLGYSLGKEH